MRSTYEAYLIGTVIIISGIAIGILAEIFAIKPLLKVTRKTKSKADDVISTSFRWLLLLLGIIGGVFLGVKYFPITDQHRYVVNQGLFVALMLILSVLLSRIIVGLIRLRIRRNPGLIPATTIISTITRVVVFVIAALVVLQTLGISITPILTALGIGGLAVALALQETLTNFFAGVQVIASKQIRQGDYIKLNTGEEGYITDITWRSTTIQMLSNSLIVVPNTKIASSILTNYYLNSREMAVLVEVLVSYDSDLKKVEDVTVNTAIKIMRTVQGGVRDFMPFIRYHSFNNNGIGFTVILRGLEFTDQYLLKHEFIKALKIAYKENHIEIPHSIFNIRLDKPDNH